MYKIGNNAFGKLSYVYSVGVELFIIIVTGWNHSVTLHTEALPLLTCVAVLIACKAKQSRGNGNAVVSLSVYGQLLAPN
jgi:hypothetical protein